MNHLMCWCQSFLIPPVGQVWQKQTRRIFYISACAFSSFKNLSSHSESQPQFSRTKVQTDSLSDRSDSPPQKWPWKKSAQCHPVQLRLVLLSLNCLQWVQSSLVWVSFVGSVQSGQSSVPSPSPVPSCVLMAALWPDAWCHAGRAEVGTAGPNPSPSGTGPTDNQGHIPQQQQQRRRQAKGTSLEPSGIHLGTKWPPDTGGT